MGRVLNICDALRDDAARPVLCNGVLRLHSPEAVLRLEAVAETAILRDMSVLRESICLKEICLREV